jgi:predicted kinase
MIQEMPTQPTLILIAGGPCAGKTSLGRALAAQFETGLLLDTDVDSGSWIDGVLAELNGGDIDGERSAYLEKLRPLEYQSLLAIALDNLALGKTVFVVAPFGPELSDSGWVRRLKTSVDELGGRLRAIWIEIDADTAKERIAARNGARDPGKLARWNEFIGDAQFAPPRSDLFVLGSDGQSTIADLANKAIIYLCLK